MGIFICVLSGIFWSIFDLTRKKSLKIFDSKTILIFFSVTQAIIFLLWVLIDSYSLEFFNYILPGLFLILLSVFSALLFLESLKISQLSLTIPLLSFTPLFSSIFSALILNENLLFSQYLGILFIITGAMFLYSKELSLKGILYSLKNLIHELGAKYMLLVSLIWSLTPVLDKVCFKYSSINIHGFIQSAGMLLILSLITSRKKSLNLNKIKKNYKIIFFTMSAGIIATVLQFFAITLTFVTIMETIKRTLGQFLSIVFGKIFFKERVNAQKILGIIIISLGILFIMFKKNYFF